MSDLPDLLRRVMRSLRAHGEHELSGEVADMALSLNAQAPAPTVVSATVAPLLASVQTPDLLAEFQRRHPVCFIIFEHSVEGKPGQSQVRMLGHPSGIVTLGLLNWGLQASEVQLSKSLREIPPGGLDEVGKQ